MGSNTDTESIVTQMVKVMKYYCLRQGEFHSGRKHGRGSIIKVDGTVIHGHFDGGEPKEKGYGHFTYDDGSTYEGNYINFNKKHGWGTYTHKDGRKLETNWVDDLPSGDINDLIDA